MEGIYMDKEGNALVLAAATIVDVDILQGSSARANTNTMFLWNVFLRNRTAYTD
jgi:hypothetical protein